jgi:hypothetical protein
MDTSILLDAKSLPQATPAFLSIHVTLTLNVTAEDARRRVNQHAVTVLGTGLIAREPELAVAGERAIWRVPLVLSLPTLGDLGQVGVVDVDAITGEMAFDVTLQERIIQHAQRLYTGATSSSV